MMQLKNVTYQYSLSNTLKNITATFERGKIYTIMGMKGAGKSMLAAILGRVVEPDSGTFAVSGRESTSISRVRYNLLVTMLRENANLFEEKTAVENIQIHLAFLGKKRSHAEILHHLEDSGVSKEKAMLKVSSLSKEEKIRYAIAQTFIEPTAFIIIDSPFKTINTTKLMDLLVRKIEELDHRKHGIVFFTDENQVLEGTDEVWGVNNGRLLFVKSMKEHTK